MHHADVKTNLMVEDEQFRDEFARLFSFLITIYQARVVRAENGKNVSHTSLNSMSFEVESMHSLMNQD